jgi:hypothetical protein
MGANEEIRKRSSLGTAATPVGQERFFCQKGGFVWNGFAIEHGFRQGGVEFLDPRIANRDLGINDRTDDEAEAVGRLLEGACRPRKPARILPS